MKKLSKAVQLLWKAYRKECKLKRDIKYRDDVIRYTTTTIETSNKTIERLHREIEEKEALINELKTKIRNNGHILRYRIQKYIPSYDTSPYSVGIKLSEKDFRNLVEDSKLKMMNELIEKGLVKMIEYDDCVEIAIHLADDEK